MAARATAALSKARRLTQAYRMTFEALLEQIRQGRGIDLGGYKPSFVQRRLAIRLHDRAQRELVTLRRLIQAARTMETGEMTQEQAAEFEQVIGPDELSQFGQAFGRMARQVLHREETLRRQVKELRIEVDEVKKARQVAEITETEYFHNLQIKARELRNK